MMENDSAQPSRVDASLYSNPKPDNFKAPKRSHSRLADILSTIVIVAAAFILAFLLITYVFQSYQVDGPSMEPTLHNNDRLIVWKLPRTVARITRQPYIPKRGDIVVFTESGLAAFGQTNTKQLIKRVIGLPGNRIVIKNGKVTIYDKNHPHGFDPDTTLPYGKTHPLPYTSGDIDITLGKNQIFVLGDNRTDSLDSRYFGPVNVNNIIGQLVLRIYPFSSFKAF